MGVHVISSEVSLVPNCLWKRCVISSEESLVPKQMFRGKFNIAIETNKKNILKSKIFLKNRKHCIIALKNKILKC